MSTPTDLKTGPVSNKDEPRSKEIPHWQMQLYDKDPPQSNDGKFPLQFTIQQKCGLKDAELRGGKCEMKLMVARVKNAHFEWDEHHGGGQLQYDERDVRQYLYCPRHGPSPAGPGTW